jgi:hypothetical protein
VDGLRDVKPRAYRLSGSCVHTCAVPLSEAVTTRVPSALNAAG